MDEQNSRKNTELYLREDMLRHPENYLQPWVRVDNQGREYCNPDFVRLYGNPHNKIQTKSIYLEVSQSRTRQEKEDFAISGYVDQEQEMLKNHTQNKYTLRPISKRHTKWDHECIVCGMYSEERAVLCWYCLTRLDIKK